MAKEQVTLKGRTAVYHCMSRICGGEMLFDDPAHALSDPIRLPAVIRRVRSRSRYFFMVGRPKT